MKRLETVELEAFVPAKDCGRSPGLYQEPGFESARGGGDPAQLHAGNGALLLQRFHVEAQARDFTLYLLFEGVDTWWTHVRDSGLAGKYGVRATPAEDRPWGVRDFTLDDAPGVLWRIGENTPG